MKITIDSPQTTEQIRATQNIKNISLFHPLLWVALAASVPMFGILSRPPILPVNLGYATFGLLLYTLVLFFGKHKRRIKFHWTTTDSVVLVLLYIMVLASLFASLLYGVSFNLLSTSSLGLNATILLYFITRISIQSKSHIYWLVGFVTFALFIQSITSLSTYFFGTDITRSALLSELDLEADVSSVVQNSARLLGLHTNPNNFATLPTIGIPLVIALYLANTNTNRRFYFILAFIALFTTLLLSFSRSAWVGVTLTSGLFLWQIRKYLTPRQRYALISMVIFVALAGLATGIYTSQSSSIRIWYLFQSRAQSLGTEESQGRRVEMWQHSTYLMIRYPTGVGINNIRNVWLTVDSPYHFSKSVNAHNSTITFMLEGSFIAALLFLILFLYLPIQSLLLFLPKTIYSKDRLLIAGLSAALLAFWIHSLAHTVHTHNIIWVSLGTLVSLKQQIKKEIAYHMIQSS